MFTPLYKQLFSFGNLAGSSDGFSGKEHNMAVKEEGGNTFYYYENAPLYNSTSNTPGVFIGASSGTAQWRFCKVPIDSDYYVASSNRINGVFSGWTFADNNITIRLTVPNNTGDPIELKSVYYPINCYLYNSSGTSGSASSSRFFMGIYHNFETSIIIPANDSVLVDITLSAGDISDISAG